MNNLGLWWEALSGIEKVYWALALPFTLFFLIQLAMTFLGGPETDLADVDTEIEADFGLGSQFFTIRNLISFFTIFSWTGLACLDNGFSTGSTLFYSSVAGLGMMILMTLLFYGFSRLKEEGNFNIQNAKGHIGHVYLSIPAKRQGTGKVQIKVQGSLHELEALSDEEEPLPTHTIVEVEEVLDGDVLCVKKSARSS